MKGRYNIMGEEIKKTGDGLNARQRAEREAEAKRKKESRKYTIIGIVIAVFAIAVILLNSSLFTNRLPALKVGDTGYSLAQTRYAFNKSYSDFYNNYSSLISYLMDTSKPLNEQTCAFDESMTWKQYFLNEGQTYLKQVTALCDAAKAEGMTLSEESRKTIDDSIATLEMYASAYGYSKDGFIAMQYGDGNNEKTLRDMLERSQLAADYADKLTNSYEYTADELTAWYDENGDDYNTIDYLYVFLSAVAEEGEDADAAAADAKAQADAIEDACDGTVEGFKAAVLAETESEAEESTMTFTSAGENREWFAASARKAGDVLRYETESGTYLYCFLDTEENDYNLVNVRHILIKATDIDQDGTISDDELAVARKAVETISEEWDGTEDGFARLANEKSEDTGSNTNGGLYENVAKGQMVEEFDAFCYGDRKSGDTAIVYGNNGNYEGYHLIYFVGEGENYRDYIADSTMRNTAFSDWLSAQMESYPVSEQFLYRYA